MKGDVAAFVGAEPQALRRLAAALAEEARAVTAARREVAEALGSVGESSDDIAVLAEVETWLGEEARRARRRAESLTSRLDPFADAGPPAIDRRGCGSVVLPVQARRPDGRRRHAPLGEPFSVAAPLACRPAPRARPGRGGGRWWGLQLVAGPDGRLVLARRSGKPRAGARDGDGAGAGAPPLPRFRRKPLTPDEARKKAAELGFVKTNHRSKGEPVFRRGKLYITRDIDQHGGGGWKMARSPRALASRTTRTGSYDPDLKPIGD